MKRMLLVFIVMWVVTVLGVRCIALYISGDVEMANSAARIAALVFWPFSIFGAGVVHWVFGGSKKKKK